MKKVLFTTLLFATIFSFSSCSKDDDTSSFSYTSGQQKAMDTFHGTFVYTTPYVGWKTKITFLEQYNPPLTIIRDGEAREYIHGSYRETLYNGDTYIFYYHVGADGTSFSTSMSKAWNVGTVHVYDLKIESTNEFKIKTINSLLWDSYIKQ